MWTLDLTRFTSFPDALAKVEEMSNVLKQSEAKNKLLEKELEDKENTISDIKKQLRKNERGFIEELKKKDQQVLTLKLELDNKGGTIAYLTTEIHKYKVLQRSHSKELAESPQSPPTSDQRIKKRSQRISSASNIKSRPVTAKGTMPRPDAEIFLARAVPIEPEPDSVAVKPTPPVLPPIAGGDDQTKRAVSRRQQLLRRRLDMKNQPEYSTLAVDKLATSTNTWVHEPDATTK